MSYSGYAILFNYRILHVLHLGYLKFVLCFCGYPVPKNNDKKNTLYSCFIHAMVLNAAFFNATNFVLFSPSLAGNLNLIEFNGGN